jgi:hypothetical protein
MEDEEEPPVETGEETAVTELSTGLKLIVTEGQIEELLKVDSVGRRTQLGKLLAIEDAEYNFRSEVTLNFHFFNIEHAVSLCLSPMKIAVFISIMKEVLDKMSLPSPTSETKGESYTCPDCFREYKRLIMMHAVEKPPAMMAIFVSSEVRLLTDYVNLTLMKHFHLYQYCLLFPREVDTVRVEVSLEDPCDAPSLANAKLLEDHAAQPAWSPTTLPGPELMAPADAADMDGNGEDDLLDNLVDRNLKAEVRELIEKKMDQLSATLAERLDERERDLQSRVAALTTGAKP